MKTIDRTECERNVCENELYRLRYGLRNLLENKGWIDDGWRHRYGNDEFIHHDNYKPSYRSPPSSDSFVSSSPRTEYDFTQNIPDLGTNKSLLYTILEAKLLNCFHANQRVDSNQSASLSITSSSGSSMLTNSESFIPHSITSLSSSTDTISSLESTSISILPFETPTPTVDLTKSKKISKNKLMEVNDYKKSRLAVPVTKASRPKKSKKKTKKRSSKSTE